MITRRRGQQGWAIATFMVIVAAMLTIGLLPQVEPATAPGAAE